MIWAQVRTPSHPVFTISFCDGSYNGGLCLKTGLSLPIDCEVLPVRSESHLLSGVSMLKHEFRDRRAVGVSTHCVWTVEQHWVFHGDLLGGPCSVPDFEFLLLLDPAPYSLYRISRMFNNRVSFLLPLLIVKNFINCFKELESYRFWIKMGVRGCLKPSHLTVVVTRV